MRTGNKNRQRTNAQSRHKNLKETEKYKEIDKLKLINPKDLEWLAWNYRGWSNIQKFSNRR